MHLLGTYLKLWSPSTQWFLRSSNPKFEAERLSHEELDVQHVSRGEFGEFGDED